MSAISEIGGYFQLELPQRNDTSFKKGVYLNSGTSALEYVLRSLPNIKTVWLPKYTCPIVYRPVRALGIDIHTYSVNQDFELTDEIVLADNEFLVYTNYFGIKDSYIWDLATKYRDRLIVDNAQAWYSDFGKEIKAIYSPRKFFGVPDGGIAVTNENSNVHLDKGVAHHLCSHLLKRIDCGASEGYGNFHDNSEELTKQGLKSMSNLTNRILSSIDYEWIKMQRRRNFSYLAERLDGKNRLTLPQIESFECPMVYPYLTKDKTLRSRLIENRIYAAKYWPGVDDANELNEAELDLVNNLIPLPIDQRYNTQDMERIIAVLTNE